MSVVERVAKAWNTEKDQWDISWHQVFNDWVYYAKRRSGEEKSFPNAKLAKAHVSAACARAAIAAMLEPSEAMAAVGSEHWLEGAYPNTIYRAMIDAALREGQG